MNEESRLNAALDLEYLFKNYIKARECSNVKTIHRAYILLHTALASDLVYLETKKIVEESKEKQSIDAVETITNILNDELKKASSKYCKYDVCWHGRCNRDVIEGSEYCQEHSEQKCHASGCEEQVEGECHGYSGSMVCGAPMCKNHKHKH